jgi:cation transporter-like permease
MKSMGVIVLFPLLSVIILSLYSAGGASREAAFVLLALSVLAALAGIILKRHSNVDS